MSTHPVNRLILRGLVLLGLALGMLTMLWALAPAAPSMAQEQSTPPPRETPVSTEPAPPPERQAVATPTDRPAHDQPDPTPTVIPDGLPVTGGGSGVDSAWLAVGVAVAVWVCLLGVWQSQQSHIPRG